MLGKIKKEFRLLATKSDGFSLVEIAIVLVIVGIMLSAGMGLYRTTMRTSKWSGAKKDLETINNSLKAFALTRGRLPCPDITAPPDGVEDCPSTNCANPPCGLPFVTLGVDGTDNWRGNYWYDVVGALADLTNQNTFCAVLYEIANTAGTGASTIIPCVTDFQGDTTDDGTIGAAGQGYTVAAITISEGDGPGRSRKNSNSTGEYEMASNPYEDNNYDDLVGELTLNDLFGDVCNTNNTQILLQGYDPNNVDGFPDTAAYVQIGDPTAPCQLLPEQGQLPVSIGQTVYLYAQNDTTCTDNLNVTVLPFFTGTIAPQPSCTSCSTTTGFDLLDCDLCPGGIPNAIVGIDGNTPSLAPTVWGDI